MVIQLIMSQMLSVTVNIQEHLLQDLFLKTRCTKHTPFKVRSHLISRGDPRGGGVQGVGGGGVFFLFNFIIIILWYTSELFQHSSTSYCAFCLLLSLQIYFSLSLSLIS